MKLRFLNSSVGYGLVSKNFHWIMTVVIILNFVIGLMLEDLEKGPLRFLLFNIHKSLGILVIILIIPRLLWRLINTVPVTLGGNKYLDKLSKYVHYFFYFILLTVAFSGWTYSSARGAAINFFGLFQVPPLVEKNEVIAKLSLNIHQISVYIFIAVLVLHVLASLFHHFILKDKTLRRMWYGSSD
jgi:cytochrome b561